MQRFEFVPEVNGNDTVRVQPSQELVWTRPNKSPVIRKRFIERIHLGLSDLSTHKFKRYRSPRLSPAASKTVDFQLLLRREVTFGL